MKTALPILTLALLFVASSPSPVKAEVRHGTEDHHHASGSVVPTPQNQRSPVATPAEARAYTYNYYYPEKSDVPPVSFQIVTTVLLLIFTGGLWVTSIWQWNIANKTLALQFRPKLIVRNFEIPLRLEGGNAKYYFIRNELVSGQFYVANIGDGPATITESLCIVYWQKGLVLPMRRPYEGNDGNNPVAGKIEPGGRLTAVFQSEELLPISQIEIGMMGYPYSPSWRVYIMGWIEYSDDLGIGRRTAFCRRFDPTTNRFMPVDDPDYEKAE